MAMNPRRLFVASCIALITSAFSFMVRQDITDPLASTFSLTKTEIGAAMGAAFLGMAAAMFVVAFFCDWLGMGRVLFLAWLCHLSGILGTIFAGELSHSSSIASFLPTVISAIPERFQPAAPTNTGFWVLWISTFLVGSGNGLVEIAINPLAATLFPREKTHYLNILHAWWPGGLIMSGLLATFLIGNQPIMGYEAWKVKMAMLLVPLAIYGLMSVGQKFPQTERVQASVSTGAMLLQALRPMFLLWAFCMLLTASTELGPNQWQESVLQRTAHVSGTLVFVYTSGLMFIMRFFAGPLAHKLSPVGMLTCSALLSAVGLYWLSYVDNPLMAFVAATVFGVGIAYFWPTMLGVTAERFPKGGALLLGLMGCFGNLAISQVLPQMGAIYDSYTVSALPSDLPETVSGPDNKKLPLVITEKESWLQELLPREVKDRIYPEGTRKLNPEARKALAGTPEEGPVKKAEAVGAANAFRWVAVLPAFLVVIFGLIALTDRLRGGYKAVHIGDSPPPTGAGPPGGA
jgi:MFS family permease